MKLSAMLCLLAVLLTAGAAAGSDLEAVKRSGALVIIGFPHQANQFIKPDLEKLRDSGQPLSELRDGEAYGGIDIEIMSAVAEHLGVKLEVHPMLTNYSDLIPALLAGDGHLIASGLTVTPSRAEKVAFSEPYLDSWIVAAALPESGIESVEDLDGLRGAAMQGSSHLEELRSLKLADLHIVETSFIMENGALVEEGEADFGVFDSRADIGSPVRADMPNLDVVVRLREFGYAFAVRPDSDLLPSINRVIERLRASGDIERLVARYSD